MAENKTKPKDINVIDFLNTIEPEKRRIEGIRLNEIFEDATGEKAKL